MVIHKNTLIIYADGSSYSKPRRGGIGVRLIYLDDLKNLLSSPENVVASKNRTNTKIVNIKLNGKPHSYLRVVIRYRSFFSKLLGKRNFIVTLYGEQQPMKGKVLWKK